MSLKPITRMSRERSLFQSTFPITSAAPSPPRAMKTTSTSGSSHIFSKSFALSSAEARFSTRTKSPTFTLYPAFSSI